MDPDVFFSSSIFVSEPTFKLHYSLFGASDWFLRQVTRDVPKPETSAGINQMPPTIERYGVRRVTYKNITHLGKVAEILTAKGRKRKISIAYIKTVFYNI